MNINQIRHLKILISHASVYKSSGWGRIFPLAVSLAKNGNSVTIITTNPKFSILVKRLFIDNVIIIIYPEIISSRISRMGFGFLSLILKLIHVIINKYDIVHSDNGHRPLSGIPCRTHKNLHDSVYVAEWYDWYGKGGQYDSKNKLFKILLGRYELQYEIKDKAIADGIVVLSDVLLKRAKKLFPQKEIVKIHGGSDILNIKYVYNNSTIKEKYGIDKNMLTLGYIDAYSGNIREIQPLIESIIELNVESKIRILIFGSAKSIELLFPDKLKNIIINYGWINYFRDYEKLQCVDVFFTFKEDTLGNRSGWPNCLGDYFACGRPIFLNPVGEVIDFAYKYPEGFIISSLSQSSIKNNLNYIISNRPKLLEMGKINRNIAENKISWQIKSSELFDFYLKIIKKKHGLEPNKY